VSLRIAKTVNRILLRKIQYCCRNRHGENVIGSEHAKKLKAIPLANSTASRRTDEMADDVRGSLKQNIKKDDFIAIQFDDLTDVSNMAQFSCFVRYVSDAFMKENIYFYFLFIYFCNPVPGHATGQCLFLETTTSCGIDWKTCIVICSGCKGDNWKEEWIDCGVKNTHAYCCMDALLLTSTRSHCEGNAY
jgi:hypothetical protein